MGKRQLSGMTSMQSKRRNPTSASYWMRYYLSVCLSLDWKTLNVYWAFNTKYQYLSCRYVQLLSGHSHAQSSDYTVIRPCPVRSFRKEVVPRVPSTDLSSKLCYGAEKRKLWQLKHCAQPGLELPSQWIFVTSWFPEVALATLLDSQDGACGAILIFLCSFHALNG